jgi:O-antigen biosynthesis protein
VTTTGRARPSVSVIVVSRRRPQHLVRCLKALSQQDLPGFEVVVVADPAGTVAIRDQPVKSVVFDQMNISAARNLGLSAAAGGIVAFIDDDAVAEPTWLGRLTAPLANSGVVAATGFVRGRDGLSWQSQAAVIDRSGQTLPVPLHEDAPALLPPPAEGAIKTVGTNMAFRRSALATIGGFDPSFRFYLDEGDVNIRMAPTGGLTAVVPTAVVHHAFAPNDGRAADRTPMNLHEIGASLAVFLRRHAQPDDPPGSEVFAWMQVQQRRRLLRHLVSGGVEPRDISRLLDTLADGWADGQGRDLTCPPAFSETEHADFLPFTGSPAASARPGTVLSGRAWQRRRLRKAAARDAAAGHIVTLVLLSPTARPHRQTYSDAGFWEQSGGLFGRAGRGGPGFVWSTFRRRVGQEVRNSSLYRQISA